MQMIISGVSEKDGEKIAYVRFEDGASYAECIIPKCEVKKSDGFSSDELSQIEQYLRSNLTDIKRQAARINPITAMMKQSDAN